MKSANHALASPDCLGEDVGVVAVVVSELELGDVQRQVFGIIIKLKTKDFVAGKR